MWINIPLFPLPPFLNVVVHITSEVSGAAGVVAVSFFSPAVVRTYSGAVVVGFLEKQDVSGTRKRRRR